MRTPYDPNVPYKLFERYVDLIQDDCDDPHLEKIKTTLKSMGFGVVVPDEEREEFDRDPQDRYIRYTINLYLIDLRRIADEESEPLDSYEGAVITIPQEEPKISREKTDAVKAEEFDARFLKGLDMKW